MTAPDRLTPRCPEEYNQGRSGPARCIFAAGHGGPHEAAIRGNHPVTWTT